MSKQLKQHIKKMSAKDNPETNKTQSKKVGQNLADSTNTDVVAQSAIVVSASDNLDKAIVADSKAHDLAVAATAKKKAENKNTADLYNAAAVIVEQKFPDQPTLWKTYGYEVTSEVAEDAKEPPQVMHGSISQGDHQGTVDIHFDSITGAEYTVEITKADPSEADKYINVTMPDSIFTKSSITIVLPVDYRDVNLWAKVTAHNTAGAGPASAPFGGRKFE
ncbi:MAG: hypothetical protein WCO65_04030 [bacterium]